MHRILGRAVPGCSLQRFENKARRKSDIGSLMTARNLHLDSTARSVGCNTEVTSPESSGGPLTEMQLLLGDEVIYTAYHPDLGTVSTTDGSPGGVATRILASAAPSKRLRGVGQLT